MDFCPVFYQKIKQLKFWISAGNRIYMPKGKTRSLYAKNSIFGLQKYGKSQKWCSLRMKKICNAGSNAK